MAALLGAGLWAGLVVLTEYEVNWFAWGVGALVGGVMSRLTPVRNVKLSVYAAVLAVLGLAVGKVMTFQALIPKYGQEMMLANEEILVWGFAFDMKDYETYSAEVSHQLSALPRPDSVPEALQKLMLVEARTRMEASSPAERERVARRAWQRAVRELGVPIQFLASLSLFDVLWFGLAIATAWKLMRGG
ncbi:MAG: hypothetical protein ACRD08_00485 [Acidimicrobiales bacterium]